MGQKLIGLYQKYIVTRTDGRSEKGQKHEECTYFVLDLNHDKFAIPAIRAYAHACRQEYPKLSEDLHDLAAVEEMRLRARQEEADAMMIQSQRFPMPPG